eukprot:1037049-Pelagomonas_calceolata.AAC.2
MSGRECLPASHAPHTQSSPPHSSLLHSCSFSASYSLHHSSPHDACSISRASSRMQGPSSLAMGAVAAVGRAAVMKCEEWWGVGGIVGANEHDY